MLLLLAVMIGCASGALRSSTADENVDNQIWYAGTTEQVLHPALFVELKVPGGAAADNDLLGSALEMQLAAAVVQSTAVLSGDVAYVLLSLVEDAASQPQKAESQTPLTGTVVLLPHLSQGVAHAAAAAINLKVLNGTFPDLLVVFDGAEGGRTRAGSSVVVQVTHAMAETVAAETIASADAPSPPADLDAATALNSAVLPGALSNAAINKIVAVGGAAFVSGVAVVLLVILRMRMRHHSHGARSSEASNIAAALNAVRRGGGGGGAAAGGFVEEEASEPAPSTVFRLVSRMRNLSLNLSLMSAPGTPGTPGADQWEYDEIDLQLPCTFESTSTPPSRGPTPAFIEPSGPNEGAVSPVPDKPLRWGGGVAASTDDDDSDNDPLPKSPIMLLKTTDL
jgi:hypothetical protein